ncbi:Arm DNA-binding domain-containing protein, partial [Providencia stuartii]
MALSARQIQTAKPKDKEYKLSDERGLYLLVKPNGARYWRMKYRFAGKEKKLSIGVYPDVSLADARVKRDEA